MPLHIKTDGSISYKYTKNRTPSQ